MSVKMADQFKVGDWLIEPELLRISKGKEVRKLEFTTMEVLLCFVSHQGEVVSKKQLHDEVWGEVFVTDNALTRAVSRLRKAFDDDPLNPRYIDTISKSGYRLVASVEGHGVGRNESSESVMPNRKWLWGVLAAFVVSGLVLASISSRDSYSGFYDPVPVSTLVGPERGLAISPDGAKMSFSYSEPGANNSDIYITLLDDLSRVRFTDHETHQGYGIWSPDGNYMAYASLEDSTCGIYKEPVFGGEKIRIGDCFVRPDDFVWSPDGKIIAFTDMPTPQESRRIFFLEVETRKSYEFLSPENGMSDRDPVFSPDGKYLVFRRTLSGESRDVFKASIEDKALTRLTFDNARILGLDLFDGGEQVAFSSDRNGKWAMWKVPATGGAISRLRINDRVPTEPKFSRNGDRMVYKSIRDQTRLWAMERKGGDYTPVFSIASSTRAEIHPSFSGDGNKVVFLSNRSGYFEIWISDLKANNLTKLTSLEGKVVNMPSWSPNGTEILFDARVEDNNAVYILDIASKLTRTFVDLDGDQAHASYSRNGKTIFFGSNHTGSWQIWKKDILQENDKPVQMTKSGGYFMQEGPDDGYLYYTRLDTTGIWRIDEMSGGEELFLPGLNDFDWGNWVPVQDGIIYIHRAPGPQIYLQPYDTSAEARELYTLSKPIQSWGSSLSATQDGDKVIFVQIENSEDEIMMVDFR